MEWAGTPDAWWMATLTAAVIVAIISFVLLAFVSFFESEFFSLNSNEIAEIKISNDKKFERLKNLSEDPLRTLGGVISTRYIFNEDSGRKLLDRKC